MILFTASWCKPCKELKQWMSERGMTLEHIDIDSRPDLAIEVGVGKVPTLMITDGSLLEGREEIKPYLEKNYDSTMSNP